MQKEQQVALLYCRQLISVTRSPHADKQQYLLNMDNYSPLKHDCKIAVSATIKREEAMFDLTCLNQHPCIMPVIKKGAISYWCNNLHLTMTS